MILIIDDDTRRLKSHIEYLVFKGYEVHQATSIKDAYEFLEEKTDQIELIILDIMMPTHNYFNYEESIGGKRTGVMLYDEIIKMNPLIPVIVYSAVSETNLAVQLKQKGVKDYIEKAVKPTVLLSRIKKYLPGTTSLEAEHAHPVD